MTFVCNQKEYMEIPLNKLFFDENIADMVEEKGYVFPTELINNIYASGAFKLDEKRLQSILDGYDTGLPPIHIKTKLGKYNVINGRHRVCATIIKGGISVPCIEVE